MLRGRREGVGRVLEGCWGGAERVLGKYCEGAEGVLRGCWERIRKVLGRCCEGAERAPGGR